LTHSIEEKLSRQLEERYKKKYQEMEARLWREPRSNIRRNLRNYGSGSKRRKRNSRSRLLSSCNSDRRKRCLRKGQRNWTRVARKVEEERGKIAAAIEVRVEQEYRLKEADRDRKFQDLLGQIEMLKSRKTCCGSRQPKWRKDKEEDCRS